MLQVKLKVSNRMSAGTVFCCAAAGKGGFRKPIVLFELNGF